jgi:hypothetical protein
MNIYDRFTSKKLVEVMSKVIMAGKFISFEDYDKKYGLTETLMIANFYEGLGVLLSKI